MSEATANVLKQSNLAGTIALALTVTSKDDTVNTIMAVSGDKTVDRAAADSSSVLGRLIKAPSVDAGLGTVETPFHLVMEVTLAATVVAGDPVIVGEDGGASESEQRFDKWVNTDEVNERIGMFLEGGDENDTVLAGFY